MKDLRHQHICQLYEVIETDEYYFLVLEVDVPISHTTLF